jgi:hypothetical protein
MSHSIPQKQYFIEIEALHLNYRDACEKLITCHSLAKEREIKALMSQYEVEIKILKRKLSELELNS